MTQAEMSTIDPQVTAARFDPQWTEPDFVRGGARDDLGIETLSEAILADLLPGINNQTRRARYYSFWAWVLRDFILDPDATHTQAGLYEWLRRREAVLILSNLSHNCGITAAGTEQGNKVWNGGQAASYALDWKSLISVNGGSYQLYYRGALQEMNIIISSENSPHDDLTKTLGVRLAEAYADSVSGTEYVRYYLDAARLRRADIDDFAQAGCLCQVRHHDLERRCLIDAFFRFDTPDAYAVKRLASLCLFLDIVAQSDGQPLDEDAFRSVLYFWSYGDHHAYSPSGNFISPAERWRVFQLRQYFVFAIETFWGLFLHRIQSETLSEEEYLAWLVSELDLEAVMREHGVALTDAQPETLPLADFFTAVRDALPQQALSPGPIAIQTSLNEHALTARIRGERSKLDVPVRAGNALLMLALMYYRCQPYRPTPAWVYASDSYSEGRLPVEAYVRQVERAFKEGWTVAGWLAWLHDRYLWLQHRRVTLEKLVSRGQETSKFDLVYDNLPATEGRTSELRRPRFQGTGTDEPKMNAPRFPSALSIMLDLALIERAENSGYRILPDAAALLERFRSYSVPTIGEDSSNEAA